ncbi:MAG: gamma carbonic anhydrase family protein [Caldisericaceae bacterium]
MIISFDGKKPKISEKAFVAETAVIIGNVTIEEGASIWFGAVLRGDIAPIVIGKNSNIQDNTVIHVDTGVPCIIKDFVTVGHNAIIHSATIGSNTLIGMGATVLSLTEIGSNSIVGANALVTENSKIQERSLLLGIPAKIVRSIRDEEIKEIKENAMHYVELAKKYRQNS